jgi:putative copper resistance protein D
MALLLDVFGFLSVLLRGVGMTAQCLTLGGIAFLALLAVPFRQQLPEGDTLARRSRIMAGLAAMTLGVMQAATTAMKVVVLAGTTDLPAGTAASAEFSIAGFIVAAAALLLAIILLGSRRFRLVPSLALALVVVLAQAMTSHAAARIDERAPLLVAEVLHQGAAAVWIGGIPYFLVGLALCRGAEGWRLVGRRFSRMAMGSVAVLFAAGLFMSVFYIASPQAILGSAYGVMVSAKVLLLGVLLAMGAANFFIVERLHRDARTPILRMRRFAEAEIGIGISVFFAAASLTSLPPAADVSQDWASWREVVDRMTPAWPRLSSPDHADLAIPQLQAKLDAAAEQTAKRPQAFVPGAGEQPPMNAADLAWSEYNHNWAGVVVLAIGILAVAERTGRAPWARHWPLLFLGLALFLFIRSDPENWPLGDIGFWESFRDPGVAQHRLFVVLLTIFAFFEWRVRTGHIRAPAAAMVFPLICAVGGALLLTHSHPLSDLKQQLLIEITHIPMGFFGVLAGWSRWLELRLPPPQNRFASWTWPVCFVAIGFLLLTYREV